MKALLILSCLFVLSSAFADKKENSTTVENRKNTVENSKKTVTQVFESRSATQKMFKQKKKGTSFLTVKDFQNKKLSVYRLNEDGKRIFETFLEVTEEALVATTTEEENKLNLLIHQNTINFSDAKILCEDACISLPVDLKKLEGEIPVLLKNRTTFAADPFLHATRGIIIVQELEE